MCIYVQRYIHKRDMIIFWRIGWDFQHNGLAYVNVRLFIAL
jgi:hypothetical protein